MTPHKKQKSNHPQPKPHATPSPPADGRGGTSLPDGRNSDDDTRRRQDAYEGQSEAHVHDDRELEPERPRDDGISERRSPGRVDIERI